MKQWDYAGDYLEQFDRDYRGAIGNVYCLGVRLQPEDPLTYVSEYCQEHSEKAIWSQVAHTVGSPGSKDFLAFIERREALPADVRHQLKAESGINYVRTKMSADAPTEKQLGFLRSLGCTIVPKTKLEASDLITQFKASRPAERPARPSDTPF